jgi:hypothetical protein
MAEAHSVDAGNDAQPWRFWLVLAVLVLAIKLVLYWFDPDVMFFLGDSASYLHTATTGWIPPDRSWVYGSLIRRVTLGTGQLELLVLFQVLVGAASCLLLGYILRQYLACSLPLVALATVGNAFEPIQLLYERYVMAENVSLLAFALFMVAVLSYLRRGRWWMLAPMAAMAVAAAALRTAYQPVTIGVALLAIGYCCWACLLSRASPLAGWRPLWRRLGLALLHVLVFALLWSGLNWLEGRYRLHTDKGYFLLAAWGPVLAQPDYPRDPLLDSLIKDLPEDCALASIDARETNLWFPECLSGRIKAHFPSDLEASSYARGLALGALKNDPLAVLGLGYQTWATLWDDYSLPAILYFDRGGKPSPPATFAQQLRDDWGMESDGWHFRKTLTNRYFFAATHWYHWVILSPLLMPLWWLLTIRRLNPASLIITAAGLVMLLVVTIPVTIVSVRFYHGIAWLAVLVSASSLDQLLAQLRHWSRRMLKRPAPPVAAE